MNKASVLETADNRVQGNLLREVPRKRFSEEVMIRWTVKAEQALARGQRKPAWATVLEDVGQENSDDQEWEGAVAWRPQAGDCGWMERPLGKGQWSKGHLCKARLRAWWWSEGKKMGNFGSFITYQKVKNK